MKSREEIEQEIEIEKLKQEARNEVKKEKNEVKDLKADLFKLKHGKALDVLNGIVKQL